MKLKTNKMSAESKLKEFEELKIMERYFMKKGADQILHQVLNHKKKIDSMVKDGSEEGLMFEKAKQSAFEELIKLIYI